MEQLASYCILAQEQIQTIIVSSGAVGLGSESLALMKDLKHGTTSSLHLSDSVD